MNQLRNFPYRCTLHLSTASPPVLTLTQVDLSTGLSRTVTWTSALLASRASPAAGAFGWLCSPGRVVEITDEDIAPPAAVHAGAALALPGLAVPTAVLDPGTVGTGWPNGFATRRTFSVPPQDDLVAATLADFILEFDTDKLPAQDWSWLAGEFLSVVGTPPNAVPYDLRFETVAGARIDHWVRLYTAAPPRLVWRMRVPAPGLATGPAGVAFPFRLYSGKAGLTASQENAAGTFAGVLAARVFPSGRDVSGKGRHMTTLVGVTAGTVAGLPGGVFGSGAIQGSYERETGAAWLGGVSALTEVITLLVTSLAGGNLWRSGGKPGDVQINARASTLLNPDGSWSTGWNPARGNPPSQAGNNSAYQSAPGSVVVGETHVWHFDRSSGNPGNIYRDEDLLVSTYIGGNTGPPSFGAIFAYATDNEGFGAGTGHEATAAQGVYGLAELWPKVLGPAWAAVNARGLLAPRGLVGVGERDLATDAVTGPVAVPLRRTIVGPTDLDVAALAYDDQVPRSAALVSVTNTDPNCAAVAVGGVARLTPAAGKVAAPAVVDYVIGKGAKRSTSRLLLTVTSGGPPPPSDAWRDVTDPLTTGWATIPPLSQVTGPKVLINSNTDLPKMNPGVPGTTYIINGPLTGSVTVSGPGTQRNPIVIRGFDDGTDRTKFPKWTYSGGANLVITGSHVYVQKICWVGANVMRRNVYTTGAASRVSIERCWSYGQSDAGGNLYGVGPYNLDPDSSVRFYRVRYCEHGNPRVRTAAGLWDMAGATKNSTNHPQNIYLYRNLISDIDSTGVASSYGTVLLSIGRGELDDLLDHKAAFYEFRVRDIVNLELGEGFEMKSSGVVIAYNTLEQSPVPYFLRFRHGHNCAMIGNLFVFGAGATMGIEARGSGHILINNWAVTLGPAAKVAATSPAGAGGIRMWGGNIDGSLPLALVKSEQRVPRPNSIAYLVGGNRMQVTIGYPDSGGGTPLGDVACVVGPAGGSLPYRNRSVSTGSYGDKDYYGRGQSRAQYGNQSPVYGTAKGGSTTITNRPIKDADYDLVPTRLFDADVGIACTVYP